MATYERVDYGSPDGAHFGGAATDLIGFYGATPIVKATLVQTTTITTTQLRTEVTALQNALVNLGLIAVS